MNRLMNKINEQINEQDEWSINETLMLKKSSAKRAPLMSH